MSSASHRSTSPGVALMPKHFALFAAAVVLASWPHVALTHEVGEDHPSFDPGEHLGGSCGARLRPLVEAKMAELGVPGVIVAVRAPGRCRWVATLGTRNVTTGHPMTLRDHVRVGSITKTFTGTVVLQLVDEGLIGLDEAISKYLTGVPNGDHITVRELLQMSSGLYNYSESVAFNRTLDEEPDKVWTVPELLEIGLHGDPYFSPGAGFHYSNTNTVLLGALVETVTGHRLEDELRTRIFEPLGMRETVLPPLDDTSISRPHPRGYMFGTNVGTLPPACDAQSVSRHDVTHASPSWTWAAGGAISTLRDLLVWAPALARGTLLSAETQAERLRWIPPSPGSALGYGLNIADFSGIIGHDGALPGFQSFVGYAPAHDATIVVLANVYPDADCGSPANVITRVIATELGLLNP
jgi:D-alanyl-D-alanine carboxypeptidase